MSPQVRKLALALHLACSVGWIGAVVAYLPLDLMASFSGDPSRVRAAWLGMEQIMTWAILPLAGATVVTGLVMSLGTRWGLFRHWWVTISLVLTLGAGLVAFVESGVIRQEAMIAASATTERVLALSGTLPHSIGGLGILLVIQVLNVSKPPGLTRYGWRKQQEAMEAATTHER